MATKPKFKGKYPGPDKFKGDPKKLAEYRAGKKRNSTSNTGSTTTKTGTNTSTQQPLSPVTTAPASNTGANASGKIGLQTNFDIESDALDNDQALRDSELEAGNIESGASIAKTASYLNADRSHVEKLGRVNASSAYRGLRGGSADSARARVHSEKNQQYDAADSEYDQQRSLADSIRTASKQSWSTRNAQLNLERQRFTNSQSGTSPTVGSEPEQSGVTPRSPISSTTTKTQPVRSSTTSKPTYKGKYPGPDKFRGNAKKLAAYRAAKRRSGR